MQEILIGKANQSQIHHLEQLDLILEEEFKEEEEPEWSLDQVKIWTLSPKNIQALNKLWSVFGVHI